MVRFLPALVTDDPVPGPFDAVTDALTTDFIPPLVAGLGVVVVAALGVVLVKWGIPQIIGFFKRTAK